MGKRWACQSKKGGVADSITARTTIDLFERKPSPSPSRTELATPSYLNDDAQYRQSSTLECKHPSCVYCKRLPRQAMGSEGRV
eukprot:4382533-Pleurochrysis_carterae.AAC.1